MHSFRKLTPGFLIRLDHYLLTQFPALWATRLHYLGFYLILALGVIFLANIGPLNLQDLPDEEIRSFLLAIPVGLAFLFWAWQVSRAKVSDQFGQQSVLSRWGTQTLLLLGVAALALIPILQLSATRYQKIQAVDVEELIADTRAYELGETYFRAYGHERQEGPGDFFTYSLENARLSDPYPSLINLWPQMTEADHIIAIEDYYRVLRKYSDREFTAYEAASIVKYLEAYRNERLETPSVEEAASEAQSNLYALLSARAQHENSRSFLTIKYNDWTGFLVMMLGFWLAMAVFVQIGLRPFFLGMVLVVGGFIVSALGVFLLSEVSHLMQEESAVLVIYAFWLTLLTVQGLRYNHRRGLHLWKLSGLAVAATMVPFLPVAFVSGMDVYPSNGAEGLLILSVCLCAWVGWLAVYQPLIERLQISPQRS